MCARKGGSLGVAGFANGLSERQRRGVEDMADFVENYPELVEGGREYEGGGSGICDAGDRSFFNPLVSE